MQRSPTPILAFTMKFLFAISLFIAITTSAPIVERQDPGCNLEFPFQAWPNFNQCCNYINVSPKESQSLIQSRVLEIDMMLTMGLLLSNVAHATRLVYIMAHSYARIKDEDGGLGSWSLKVAVLLRSWPFLVDLSQLVKWFLAERWFDGGHLSLDIHFDASFKLFGQVNDLLLLFPGMIWLLRLLFIPQWTRKPSNTPVGAYRRYVYVERLASSQYKEENFVLCFKPLERMQSLG